MNLAHRPTSPAVLLAVAALPLSATGCRVVGGIFKAGVGVGVVAVVLVLAIVGGLVALLSRGARA